MPSVLSLVLPILAQRRSGGKSSGVCDLVLFVFQLLRIFFCSHCKLVTQRGQVTGSKTQSDDNQRVSVSKIRFTIDLPCTQIPFEWVNWQKTQREKKVEKNVDYPLNTIYSSSFWTKTLMHFSFIFILYSCIYDFCAKSQ